MNGFNMPLEMMGSREAFATKLKEKCLHFFSSIFYFLKDKKKVLHVPCTDRACLRYAF